MKGRGITLGTLFGIRIQAHPSWFVIVALVVISLATLGGPAGTQIQAAPLRWVLALVVASLFFGSVLIHELAHALVARRRGMEVTEITLFIFGGAANLAQEAPTPRTEALISAAGPLASMVLGFGFLGIWWLIPAGEAEVAELIRAASYWLGISNLLLAGFNLIPGFPMDGGRLLRALIWGQTGEFVRATRIATTIGRIFAYGLIAVGVVVALNAQMVGGVVTGIWLAFIGWFLNQAAEASYRRVEFERLLEGVRVEDVMDHDVDTVSPNLMLDALVEQHLITGRASFYPVTMDDDLVGTVDLGQVRQVPRVQWPVTRVTDVMTRGAALTTLTGGQSIMDAVTRFEEEGVLAIPVVADGSSRELVGLVTRDGLFRALHNRAALRP